MGLSLVMPHSPQFSTIQLPVTKTYKYQVEAFGRTIASRAAFPLEPEDGLANIELISQAGGW